MPKAKAKSAKINNNMKKSSKKGYESFQVASESKKNFMTFKITKQTLYWIILLALIFLLSFWVLSIHLEVSDILDSINSAPLVDAGL